MVLIFKDEVNAIIGAAMDVECELGSGSWNRFIRKPWKCKWPTVKFLSNQKTIKIAYRGKTLKKEFVTELICYEKNNR